MSSREVREQDPCMGVSSETQNAEKLSAWKSLYFCAKEHECKYCIKILYITSVISANGRRRRRRRLSWRKQQCLLREGFYFKDFQKYFMCYLQSCILIKTRAEIFITMLRLTLGSLSQADSELLYQLWGVCVQQTAQRLNFVQRFSKSYDCKLCFSRVWGWNVARYCCFNVPITWVYKAWEVISSWLLKNNLLQCSTVQTSTIIINVKKF